MITPTVEYPLLVPGFVLAGIGMGLFFAPIANVVLSSVDPIEEGQASGATNTIREIGGVFGVAVLASVFSSTGSYASPTQFVDGLVPAVWVGAAIVAVGAVVALALPGRARREVIIAGRRRPPARRVSSSGVGPATDSRLTNAPRTGELRRRPASPVFVYPAVRRLHLPPPSATGGSTGVVARNVPAELAVNIRSVASGLGIDQRAVAGRAGPADGQAQRRPPRTRATGRRPGGRARRS